MMRVSHLLAAALAVGLLHGVALAEQVEDVAPLPKLERITPAEQNPNEDGILSTHDTPAAEEKPKPSPFQKIDGVVGDAKPTKETSTSKPVAPPVGMYQPTVPFGRAESSGTAIPSAPHSSVAVPVGNVDAVEASEPAPPTPVAPETDPAKENPEEPTELTSPIFEAADGVTSPRSVTLRALNKVTAQAAVLTLKPNESQTFGQLEVRAITCQTSSPKSQMDHAALLDIREKTPTNSDPKPLFRGWMYASSPSITALEHPVYDVSVVACNTPTVAAKPADKKEEKPSEPTKKADKKPKG